MSQDLRNLFFLGLSALAPCLQAQRIDQLYMQLCQSCHGAKGQGGLGGSLIDGKWVHGAEDADLTRTIRDGLPDNGMPGFGRVLSDEQIRGMVIYLRERENQASQATMKPRLEAKAGVVQSELYTVQLETVAEVPGTLWAIAFLPDGTMLVTEKEGRLWQISADGKRTEIAGLPKVSTRGQGGLLEVALHPDFAENGWIYLSHSDARFSGKSITRVIRGRVREGKWVDEQVLLEWPERFHNGNGVHFGSRFVFQDGYLYFSIGDRGNGTEAQDLARPNGKIHRIHDDGRIPEDNPFVGRKDALPSIWTYGNRNPQGMDLDPRTGLLWQTEHGPRGGDELNLVRRGANYGWPTVTYGMNYDGTPITSRTESPEFTSPVLHWTPSIAVCGMDFYEGQRFPQWQGNLFAGGLASEQLHRLVIEGDKVVHEEIVLKGQGRIRDVASGPDGYLYLVVNQGNQSRILRLSPAE